VWVDDHADARFSYRVHLFRNIDPGVMLADPVTAVFAPLGRSAAGERPALVREAARGVAGSDLADRRRRLECLKVIAALRIPRAMLEASLEEVVMPLDVTKSSTVRPHLIEAEARGKAEGWVLGIKGMLEVRFGDDPRITAELAAHLAGHPDPAGLIAGAATLDELLA
jgi:hypothetical protein